MSPPVKLFACLLLALVMCSLVPMALSYGTGVKAYVPPQRSIAVDSLPFSYNGSFIVYNDGYRDGVYIIRVSVTEPSAINWLNLSDSIFTLRPGDSKLINISFNVTADNALPGDHEFVFMPTLLTTHVEPYMDQFANYTSVADPFNFTLSIHDGLSASVQSTTSTPIVFTNQSNSTNLIQSSVLQDHKVVTLIDRAIKLDSPDSAMIGQPVPLSTSIFEGLSGEGISLMAVSPDGIVYPVSGGNFTFDKAGLWGVIVRVGDEILLGKTVDVTPVKSPLAGLDWGTILAGLSLLVILSVVPLWFITPVRKAEDPYSNIIYKAYIIKKYMEWFDKERLRRAVSLLTEEYDGLVAKNAPGSREEAKRSIDELDTLARLD